MSVYALDSNIISFYLRENASVIENIEKAISNGNVIVIPPKRNAGRNTEDADIFIAAFCIHNNYILVTDNIKHFSNITDLRTINWAR